MYAQHNFYFDQNKNKMSEEAKTIEEETKTVETNVEEETKPVSLQEFLNKSFECLFNQNVQLHRALAQVLQDEFKKQEKRKLELEEKIELLEKISKKGFCITQEKS